MKNFRIYRPTKNGNGFASEWQLSYKENNKFDQYMMFLTVAPQIGIDEETKNAKFDWKEKAIVIKLGENDIAELIATFSGMQPQLGAKGLFHQTPNGGNKNLAIVKGDTSFSLKISSQDTNKIVTGPYFHSISNGEASILLVLLRRAVERIFDW
jgi:hypothetical protein